MVFGPMYTNNFRMAILITWGNPWAYFAPTKRKVYPLTGQRRALEASRQQEFPGIWYLAYHNPLSVRIAALLKRDRCRVR